MPYKFLNLNPLSKREEDCVTRAITLATQEDYNTIKRKLYLIAELFNCDKLCECCYHHLLENVYNYERIYGFKDKTIKEFCSKMPIGTYLIRVDGHLTCVIDGTIYDIWNCEKEIIDKIWKVENM